MIIEKIWTGNAYRNFNYLIVCPDTGEALAIDPLDHQKCLNIANDNHWDITQILNTHDHWDHIGGNKEVVDATSAKIIAHENAKDLIPNINRGVKHGEVIKVGRSIELECLDTPGHTLSHICLLSHTEAPALFSGDTLFNAGAGNCHNGGDPQELYKTFSDQLEKLSPNTQIYPGHDYLINNLEFTLDREPDNNFAKKLLNANKDKDPTKIITTIGEEKNFNAFFRLQNSNIIEKLRESFKDIGSQPSPETVFLKLRELRNNW
jgi:hydroxyacylglutathione hydrolase|tara:strand:+ start:900 stop:1688 length:789 start_codon:yes stop_codon:yes gene_type:complete